jgi:hypothetical protein
MRPAKTGWGELASHMCPVSCEQMHNVPSLKAKKLRKLPQEKVLLELGVPGVISGKFSVRETATKSLLSTGHDNI